MAIVDSTILESEAQEAVAMRHSHSAAQKAAMDSGINVVKVTDISESKTAATNALQAANNAYTLANTAATNALTAQNTATSAQNAANNSLTAMEDLKARFNNVVGEENSADGGEFAFIGKNLIQAVAELKTITAEIADGSTGATPIDLSAYATKAEVNAGLSLKQDAQAGKGLSTEDFTTVLKEKLQGISENTTWENIQNKPSEFTPEYHTHETTDVEGLKPIATSGASTDASYDNTKASANPLVSTNIQSAIDELLSRYNYLETAFEEANQKLEDYEQRILALENSQGSLEPITVTNGYITPDIAPKTGETPLSEITSTQFSGIVAWSPTVMGVFNENTVYTATITLTAANGYTLEDANPNFNLGTYVDFTSIDYNAETKTLIIVFPETLPETQAPEPDSNSWELTKSLVSGEVAPILQGYIVPLSTMGGEAEEEIRTIPYSIWDIENEEDLEYELWAKHPSYTPNGAGEYYFVPFYNFVNPTGLTGTVGKIAAWSLESDDGEPTVIALFGNLGQSGYIADLKLIKKGSN